VYGIFITMESAGVGQEERSYIEQLVHEVLVLGMSNVAPDQLTIQDVTTPAVTTQDTGIVFGVELPTTAVVKQPLSWSSRRATKTSQCHLSTEKQETLQRIVRS
jgi:hypothetical protein